MYIKRQLTSVLKQASETFPVVIVTGPRQAGKTTLLKHTFGEKSDFISMDTMDLRLWAKNDPRDFLNNNRPPLIIDEFQYVPELLLYIKERIDENRLPGSYFLTGSQQLSVMKNVSESLAGRAALLELLPLSRSEMRGRIFSSREEWFDNIIRYNEVKQVSPGSAMMQSCYPELYVNRRIDSSLWFSSYVQTYLERDVKTYFDIGNLESFHHFITLLAARTASVLNFNSYTSEIGVSMPTVKKWFSILEASGIVFTLRPYSGNIGKRITKAPKFYFTDTALATHLAGINSPEYLIRGNIAGQFFENMVIAEFRKALKNFSVNQNQFYINHRNLWEVDLLLEENMQLTPVEVKLAATIGAQHMKNFSKLREVLTNIAETNYLICNIDNNFTRSNTTLCSWQGL